VAPKSGTLPLMALVLPIFTQRDLIYSARTPSVLVSQSIAFALQARHRLRLGLVHHVSPSFGARPHRSSGSQTLPGSWYQRTWSLLESAALARHLSWVVSPSGQTGPPISSHAARSTTGFSPFDAAERAVWAQVFRGTATILDSCPNHSRFQIAKATLTGPLLRQQVPACC